MSFVAGIVKFENYIDDAAKKRFDVALHVFEEHFSWPLAKIETNEYIIVQSSTPDMWEGPKTVRSSSYDAVATGIQWKRIPSSDSATEYLATQFLSDNPEIENYFDYFSCAVIDKANKKCVLATDPLGVEQIVYHIDNGILLFSSNQSFIRQYLGPNITINWDSVFAYLLIRHFIGNKTLLDGVNLLPLGTKLEFQLSGFNISKYFEIDNVGFDEQITVEKASNLVWDHLNEKFANYCSIAEKDFVSLLSGGWDSRLITAFLSQTGKLENVFTTEQDLQLWGRYIVQWKLAQDVTKFLGITNHCYIKPENDQDIYKLATMLDYSTTFHRWSLSMVNELPEQKILTDGYFGDVLLRGTHISNSLRKCIYDKNKAKAVQLTFVEYITGTNIGSASTIQHPDAESWKNVLDPSFVSNSLTRLKQIISKEFNDIHSDNFITMFQIKNRQRRCISWLPRGLIGSKGAVLLPFCDPEFVKLALSIPIKMKHDKSLFVSLLEKTKRGLSKIPSTNTEDKKVLEPYMSWMMSGFNGILFLIFNKLPVNLRWKLWSKFSRVSYHLLPFWQIVVDEIIKSPPNTLIHLLTPQLRKAIKSGNRSELTKHAFHLYHILLLDMFFSDYIPVDSSSPEVII